MNGKKTILTVIVLVFPIIYFGLIFKYSVNIPSYDDYNAILEYIMKAPDLRIKAIPGQHNEHRIAITRILTEIVSKFQKAIDLRYFMLIGNFFLVGVFFLLVKETESKTVDRLTLSAILFAPISWLNMFWGMAAVQNHGVHFFALLAIVSFFSSLSSTKRYAGFLIFSFISAYTSGSGIFTPAAILVTLGLIRMDMKRAANTDIVKTQNFVVIILTSGFLAILYFWGYYHPPWHPPLSEALIHPVRLFHYFFCFIGNWCISLGGNQTVSTFIGVLLSVGFLILSIRRAYTKTPVLFTFSVYILISILAADLTRSGFGVAQCLHSRYRIIAVLFLSTLFLMYVQMFPVKKFRFAEKIILAGSAVLMFCFVTYLTMPKIKYHRYSLITETAKWFAGQQGLHCPLGSKESCAEILRAALEKGIYQPSPEVLIEAARIRKTVPVKMDSDDGDIRLQK